MRRFRILYLVFLLLAASALLIILPGCPVDDDDDDDDDDDSAPDDDVTDDDMIDDDTGDDDTTDDDTTDDDTTDDDTTDDDTTDDDTTDDDTTDDDTGDDDTGDDDTMTEDPLVLTGVRATDLFAYDFGSGSANDSTITHIDGGALGHNGVGLAVGAQLSSDLEQLVAENVVFHSLARDEQGHLHVAYVTNPDDGLWYATNASGSWAAEQAMAEPGVQYLDMAVAGGAVHISYNRYDGDDWFVHYLTNAGGSWVDEQLEDDSYITTITADALGVAHLLYVHYGQLKYRTNRTGSWTTTNLGGATWWFTCFDSFLDPQGDLHVAVVDAVYGMVQEHFVYYLKNDGGNWNAAQAFHDNGFDYFITQIALLADDAGTPHIAFNSAGLYYLTREDRRGWNLAQLFGGEMVNYLQSGLGGGDRLYFAYFNSSRGRTEVMAKRDGDWERLPVESGGYVRANVDLAVDGEGHRHAVYYDCTSDAWRYATDASGQWIVEAVLADVGGDVGFWATPSLAVDEDDAVHIGFYRAATTDLLYATNATGAWVTETVDSQGDVGNACSLAVSADGRVHVAYESTSRGGLIYAVRDGGEWSLALVGECGDEYGPVSLALAEDGAAHVAFMFEPERGADYIDQVRYATNASGVWVVETVDAGPAITVVDVALALDSDGYAHLAYPYWDYPDDTVMAATNTSGSWVLTDVLNGVDGNYIYDVDIAVDAAGHTHIVTPDQCSGETCGRLCYATDATGAWTLSYPAIAEASDNSVAIALAGDQVEAVYTGEFALWHAQFPQGSK